MNPKSGGAPDFEDTFDVIVVGFGFAGAFSAIHAASAFGFLYLSGGNLSECVVGGRIAGREAAALEPWDRGAGSCRDAGQWDAGG
jgi:succinate dehydrogenase/fumarate reductase flavoprotein subunit